MRVGDVIGLKNERGMYSIYRVMPVSDPSRTEDIVYCESFPEITDISGVQSFDDLQVSNAEFCTCQRARLEEGQTLFNHPIEPGKRGDFIYYLRDVDQIRYAEIIGIDTKAVSHGAIEKFVQGELRFDRAGDGTNEAAALKRAIALFDAALELEPEFTKALEVRGDAYSALMNYKAAIADFESALQIDPDSQRAVYGLAWTLGKAGESARARTMLREAMTKWPDDAKSFYNCLESIPDTPLQRMAKFAVAIFLVNLPVAALIGYFNDPSKAGENPVLAPLAYYGAVACLFTTLFLIFGPRMISGKRQWISFKNAGYLGGAFGMTWVIGFILMAIGKWYGIL